MINNTGLNNKYQFENFVEKDGNDLAKKGALAVVENLGLKYNPLYIYGKKFQGKHISFKQLEIRFLRIIQKSE
ncbi:MAG: DnaA/Hda family protein [Streptococcus sp.]|nr:DnaA/Hda family protein [Streptococcus sp.]MDO4660384.1 DnaA/Hda family protein [Streptococcus sp.]